MKFLKSVSSVLSYYFAWTTVWTYKEWAISRYIFSQYEGSTYQWALEANERSLMYGVVFFLLYLLFSYLPNKKISLLPLGITSVVLGVSTTFQYIGFSHEGLQTLGTMIGVGYLLLGLFISVPIVSKRIRLSKAQGQKNKSEEQLVSNYNKHDHEIPVESRISTIDQEKTTFRNSNTKVSDRRKLTPKMKLVIIGILSIVIASFIFFNFLYYPHNGSWEADFYGKKVVLKLDKGEGVIGISYDPDQKVILYDPNKRETTAGIDGKTNNIKVNKDVLVIEMSGVYLKGLGLLDDDLYFKKK